MTFKEVFINPEEARLRAAWRIVIFLLAFAGTSWAVFGILIPLMTSAGIVRSTIIYGLITALVLLAVTWGMCRVVERRPLKSVGLGFHNRTVTELVQGVALGTLMMGAIFAVLTASGMAEFHFKSLTLNQIAAMTSFCLAEFTLVAWNEELFTRGYLFQTLAEGTNRTIAVGVFALLFAVLHMKNPNVTVFSLVNIAIAGVWLSLAYLKTRGLWLPIGLHFSWNFFQNHVFSFPVSGVQMSDTQLGVLRDTGPAWITGGTFGPEGGALATLALIAGSLAIWYLPVIRTSERAWTRESALHAFDDPARTADAPAAPIEQRETDRSGAAPAPETGGYE